LTRKKLRRKVRFSRGFGIGHASLRDCQDPKNAKPV
jgi:hypothetical protein